MEAWARKTRGIIRRDTRALQPLAADVLNGSLYFVTDESVLERSNGSAWQDCSSGAIGSVLDTHVTSTATGTQNNWAPGLSSNTFVVWSGASALTVSGLAGGVTGQRFTFKNGGSSLASFINNSGLSSAGNKLKNIVASGNTPVAPLGSITYEYDGTDWLLISHEQGQSITPTYNAADFTGQGLMTWTVDAGDVIVFRYRLNGSTLLVDFVLRTTTVGGTLNKALHIKIPGGFTAANQATNGYMYNDNAAGYLFAATWIDNVSTPTLINLYAVGFGTTNWSASTSLTHVYGQLNIEVL